MESSDPRWPPIQDGGRIQDGGSGSFRPVDVAVLAHVEDAAVVAVVAVPLVAGDELPVLRHVRLDDGDPKWRRTRANSFQPVDVAVLAHVEDVAAGAVVVAVPQVAGDVPTRAMSYPAPKS